MSGSQPPGRGHGTAGSVMATPPRVPAGWYPDPSARHERRYWDGTDWTAQVSDGGVAATDLPSARPSPASEHPAEPPPAAGTSVAAPPVAAPPAAAPPPDAAVSAAVPPPTRRRRAWAIPVAAIAAVVVLGLVAGLVIWAPWRSPPLLRPGGLVAGPSTTGSVAFRWAGPATGPPPDRYVISRDGEVVGSVAGTVTTYRGTGLAPATAYRYRVAAARDGKRSAFSPALVVSTATPPVSAARLQGPWTVTIKIVKGGASLSGADKWKESWVVSPKCQAGPCAV